MHQIWRCSWTRVLDLNLVHNKSQDVYIWIFANFKNILFFTISSIIHFTVHCIFVLTCQKFKCILSFFTNSNLAVSTLDYYYPNNKHGTTFLAILQKRPGRDTYIFACYLVTRLIFALFFLFLLLLFSVLARVASIDKQWIGIKNYMSRYHLPLATSTSLGEVFSMKTAPHSPAPSIYYILF